MLSERAFDLYREYLKSDSDSSKSNVFILLSLLLQKYHAHMDDENKVNSSLPYGFDDEEDEESVSATPAAIKPDMKIV